MEAKTRRIYKFLIRLLVTACLLGFILTLIDLKQFTENLKLAQWHLLIVVWAVGLLSCWIQAFKLKLILRKQDCNVNTPTVFRASTVTAFYSMIIPATFGTAVKWYILKRETNKGKNVLIAMVYNQATDLAVKISMGLVAIIATNWSSQLVLSLICTAIIVGLIFICFLMLNQRTGTHLSTAIRFMLRPFPKSLRSKVETLFEQIKIFQNCPYRFHLATTGFCIIVSLLDIVIYLFAAKASGINIPAIALAWQSSAVYVLGRLPISIANLGVREFTLIKFLSLYGIKPPAVLLMSMIIFSAKLLMALIGAIWQINWAIRKRKPAKQLLCSDGKCL